MSGARWKRRVLKGSDRVLNPLGLRLMSTTDVERRTVDGQRRTVTEVVERATGGVVAEGPFAGMRMPPASSWGSGSRAPKLLGCYELDVHPALERLIAQEPPTVVNFGCADGYYAVGLARRLPAATVLAVDLDPIALEECRRSAVRNDVGERVVTLLPDEVSDRIPAEGPSLWVVDVEGGEVEVLDPQRHPSLGSASVLVECHDFLAPGVTEALESRFAPTHRIERVPQGPRDPNRYPALADLPESLRWGAVDEWRQCAMWWLVIEPRAGGGGRPE